MMEDVDAASTIVQRRAESSPGVTLTAIKEMQAEADKAAKRKSKEKKKDAASGDEKVQMMR